jgi:Mn-dependent DtxR family transcriptional regulator
MDDIKKKKILKMLYNEKKENPENPEVSIADLEDKLNIEGAELDSYIRDLTYRGYIEYEGPKTFEGQDIKLTSKGEKNV